MKKSGIENAKELAAKVACYAMVYIPLGIAVAACLGVFG